MFGVKTLEATSSQFNNEIRVVKSINFGTHIQVGGLTQSGGIVETIWKATLKRVKDEGVEKILVLGLGGGTVAKLLRRRYPEASITGVEIDPLMVELGRKYLNLDESRVKAVISDAIRFDSTGYDLVVVDVYSGNIFPKKFESEMFLKKLAKNKTVIINRLYFGDKRAEAIKFGSKLEKTFLKVEWYYPQANLMFICRS